MSLKDSNGKDATKIEEPSTEIEPQELNPEDKWLVSSVCVCLWPNLKEISFYETGFCVFVYVIPSIYS